MENHFGRQYNKAKITTYNFAMIVEVVKSSVSATETKPINGETADDISASPLIYTGGLVP
jgi:hypothetical protein